MFLPIARDSLILGERFMSDIIDGLQHSLDLDAENDVAPPSHLSGVDARMIGASVRGVATPPRPSGSFDKDSPCALHPPPRQLGALRLPESSTEEPMYGGPSGTLQISTPTPPREIPLCDI